MQMALSATGSVPPPTLVGDLARRLGKPKVPASGKAENMNTWTAHQHSAAVREGTFASPIDDIRQHVVLLELPVDQPSRIEPASEALRATRRRCRHITYLPTPRRDACGASTPSGVRRDSLFEVGQLAVPEAKRSL